MMVIAVRPVRSPLAEDRYSLRPSVGPDPIMLKLGLHMSVIFPVDKIQACVDQPFFKDVSLAPYNSFCPSRCQWNAFLPSGRKSIEPQMCWRTGGKEEYECCSVGGATTICPNNYPRSG
jgi:hypothetical protein